MDLHLSPGYSATKAAELAGLSYRMVDYYAREGLVHPHRPAKGSGTRRVFSNEDVVRLRLVASLVAVGFKVAAVRRILEQLDDDPADWWPFFYVESDGALSTLRPQTGACVIVSTADVVAPKPRARVPVAA